MSKIDYLAATTASLEPFFLFHSIEIVSGNDFNACENRKAPFQEAYLLPDNEIIMVVHITYK